jgi:hypothetical protein
MTVKHLYPAVEPSLNLDFANSKRLDSRITFTRGSTGTYTDESGIIRTAAANEARFDHDSDGNSLGLLIEESRTNYTPDGTGFTVTTGAGRTQPIRGTFSSTSVVNPTGSTGTTLFTTNVTSGTNIQIYGDDYPPGNVGNAMSMFIKPNGITKIFLTSYTSASNQGAYFDLTGEGSVAGVEASLPTNQYFIHAYPNGWYRLGVRTSTGAPVSYRCAVWEYDGSNNPQWTSVTGDGTSGFYIWGWQNEIGGSQFWTSVIPTSGSTVTRAADAASMTGTNFSSWYNQSEGTVFVDLPTNLNSVGNNDVMFSFHNGSTNRVLPQWVSYSWFWKAAGTQIAINPYVSSTSTAGKYAFSFDSNDIAATYNGQTANTVTSSSLVQDVTGLRFFTEWNGGRAVYGHISRFTYYPVRLPDATLQALTL